MTRAVQAEPSLTFVHPDEERSIIDQPQQKGVRTFAVEAEHAAGIFEADRGSGFFGRRHQSIAQGLTMRRTSVGPTLDEDGEARRKHGDEGGGEHRDQGSAPRAGIDA